MKIETIELILQLLNKEKKLWTIEVKHGVIGSAREKLEKTELAETDFRKAVGLWAPEE